MATDLCCCCSPKAPHYLIIPNIYPIMLAMFNQSSGYQLLTQLTL